MRRKIWVVLTLVFALLIAAGSAVAHHGFAAEFDKTKCMTLQGTLTGVDWENPHVYFHMDVKDGSGKVAPWTLETNSTMAMKRSGTSRQDFLDNIGKVVTARACPAKRGGTENRGAAETLKLSDGGTRIVGQDVEGLGLNNSSYLK